MLFRSRLLRGRLFDQTDGPNTQQVALIGETLARRHFPNEDPLGHTIQYGNMDGDHRSRPLFRSTENDPTRSTALVAELVALNPAVVIVQTTQLAVEMARASKTRKSLSSHRAQSGPNGR